MADEFDEEKEEESGEEEAPKKGKSKLIIILVVALVVVGGGGFAAYKFLLSGPEEPPAVTVGEEGGPMAEGGEESTEMGDAPAGGETKGAAIYPLDPFIVNLADPVGNRYLKVKVALQLDNEPLQAEVERKIAPIRDGFLLLLSSKNLAQINTTEGKLKLRSELLHRVNQVLKKGRVTTIYFTEFVVQ
jgi:flagellar FliL protein